MRKERWVFSDEEVKKLRDGLPVDCQPDDEFVAVLLPHDDTTEEPQDDAIEVLVCRDGRATNRFADGTAGVSQEIKEMAEAEEVLGNTSGEPVYYDNWLDVLVDETNLKWAIVGLWNELKPEN